MDPPWLWGSGAGTSSRKSRMLATRNPRASTANSGAWGGRWMRRAVTFGLLALRLVHLASVRGETDVAGDDRGLLGRGTRRHVLGHDDEVIGRLNLLAVEQPVRDTVEHRGKVHVGRDSRLGNRQRRGLGRIGSALPVARFRLQ